MKFGQITGYNMRNIFVEKSYVKCSEASPKPFRKKSELSIQQCEILYSLFSLYFQVKVY